MKEEIIKLFDEVIGKQLTKNIYKIKESDDLFDHGLDSIGFISIIIELEKKFDIFIDEDDLDLDKFNNIAYITSYIENAVEK